MSKISRLDRNSLKYFKTALILLLVVAVYIWAGQSLDLNLQALGKSWPYVIDFGRRLFPPDLSVLDVAMKSLLETVQMSLWGTTLGALLSVPIAISSAHNVAPVPLQGNAADFGLYPVDV